MEQKKKKRSEIKVDTAYHLLNFDKDEGGRLVVFLDGVQIEKDDSDLALLLFEHGLWFQFQPLPKPEDFK